ncbi:peptide methionine sulfoxide reductase [Psychroserpens algicola]|uniref:Peptide methionine sulfoxide reductase n=1 Tax=Psychroserpens algicola TaxID=1719034 RepID=A0ABT0H5T3_9FLAO|nr:peptide methionine sulfoxide reductase [Psychroserpens algicola]MCK8479379.1 peptide methionine sulfoxide reductase [Psychroserpens algicola]
MSVLRRIQALPERYSEVIFQNTKYGVTRTNFNEGKSIKIYAEALSGNNVISFNYYITSNKQVLKPCEMPEEKVIQFLNNYQKIYE